VERITQTGLKPETYGAGVLANGVELWFRICGLTTLIRMQVVVPNWPESRRAKPAAGHNCDQQDQGNRDYSKEHLSFHKNQISVLTSLLEVSGIMRNSGATQPICRTLISFT
jgi:hypothetical protein